MLHVYCDCSVFAVLTDERYFVAAAPVVPQFPVTGVVPHLHTVLGSPGIVRLRARPARHWSPGRDSAPGSYQPGRPQTPGGPAGTQCNGGRGEGGKVSLPLSHCRRPRPQPRSACPPHRGSTCHSPQSSPQHSWLVSAPSCRRSRTSCRTSSRSRSPRSDRSPRSSRAPWRCWVPCLPS